MAELKLVEGAIGYAVYLNDHRIAGPKPLCGAVLIAHWNIEDKEVKDALQMAESPATVQAKRPAQHAQHEISAICNEMIAQAERVELEGEFTDEGDLREWVRRLRAVR